MRQQNYLTALSHFLFSQNKTAVIPLKCACKMARVAHATINPILSLIAKPLGFSGNLVEPAYFVYPTCMKNSE
jgi:hypothetical protein